MKGRISFWCCMVVTVLAAGSGLLMMGTSPLSAGDTPATAAAETQNIPDWLAQPASEASTCATCDPTECSGTCAFGGKAGYGVWACTGLPCEERCECVALW